jgi:23S rRNA (guanosine2251-2'-O)-methyltransferase
MKQFKKTFFKTITPRLDFTAQRERSEDSAPRHARPRAWLAFGVEPVRELLAAGQQVEVLYVSRNVQRRFAEEIQRVSGSGGKVAVVDEQMMRQLCGPQACHQGLAALCRSPEYADLDELVKLAPDPLLVIDGVTDPRNLGAIMRSAEGAGVRAIIVARDHTAEVSATAIKASAGARAHLTIARCGNVASTLKMLKQHGYWVGGLAPQGEQSLYDMEVNRQLALVVGGEHRGLRPIVARNCDFLVAIPMYGKVASLNVAVASAVTLYEIARRRAISRAALQTRRVSHGEQDARSWRAPAQKPQPL